MDVYNACAASDSGRAFITRDGLHTVAQFSDHTVELWELVGHTVGGTDSWKLIEGVERDHLVHDRGDWRCLPFGTVNYSLSLSRPLMGAAC